MRLARRIAGWVMTRHSLVQDLCAMAEERDAAVARAEEAERIADAAVAKADLYHGWLLDFDTTAEDVAW